MLLQLLFREGPASRADLARASGLTRVTVSDLVGEMLADGLVAELGAPAESRVGKPPTLVGLAADSHHVIALDLSETDRMTGAVVNLAGTVLAHHTVHVDGAVGEQAVALVVELVTALRAMTERPVLGIGVGSPGVVDSTGTVIDAPNLAWSDLPLAERLDDAFDLPVFVANDANTAVLGEHTFGESGDGGLMVIRVGTGVGAGLVVSGSLLHGHLGAAGEIGHVVVDPTASSAPARARAAWRRSCPPRACGGVRPSRASTVPPCWARSAPASARSSPDRGRAEPPRGRAVRSHRAARRTAARRSGPDHPRTDHADQLRRPDRPHLQAGRGRRRRRCGGPGPGRRAGRLVSARPPPHTERTPVVRIKKSLTGLAVAALALTSLAACGSDDDTSGSNDGGGPESADIRVWLNGTDTPQEARDWLEKTFEEDPGSTLTIEQQEWDGLVEKLTTSLSSESETPDVVEIGNTQAPTFTSAGAFADMTDALGDLGGDDLLPGFVDGATVDGATYAVPYYAGSKYIFYRKDLLEKAGLEVPTTLDEFVQTAVALKEANPKPANFSGFWFPGQDWRNGAAFVWAAGGDLAVDDGGEWTPALSSPDSVAGLEMAQQLFEDASVRPRTATRPTPGPRSAPVRSA